MVDDEAVRKGGVGLDDDVVLGAFSNCVGGSSPMNQRIWLTMGFVSQAGSRLSRSSGPKLETPMALTRPLVRNSSMAFQICRFSSRQSLPTSFHGHGAWTRYRSR